MEQHDMIEVAISVSASHRTEFVTMSCTHGAAAAMRSRLNDLMDTVASS
jgi:hypothetical protein